MQGTCVKGDAGGATAVTMMPRFVYVLEYGLAASEKQKESPLQRLIVRGLFARQLEPFVGDGRMNGEGEVGIQEVGTTEGSRRAP